MRWTSNHVVNAESLMNIKRRLDMFINEGDRWRQGGKFHAGCYAIIPPARQEARVDCKWRTDTKLNELYL